ncbi:MAG: hypothetical protein AAF216_13900 [Pseudomonadota bacterium]
MDEAGGSLELVLDTTEPVEVRDFSLMLSALASQYDDFLDKTYGQPDSDTRFFVKEVRKGSYIIEMAAIAVGMMDQAIILKQFFELTKGHVRNLLAGEHRSEPVQENKRHIVDMVQAVANSDKGSLTLAFRERNDPDGASDTALVITKDDAGKLTRDFESDLFASEQKEAVFSEERSAPRRVLMRLYQHNQDPNVANKKDRTQHKAIIRDIDDKPKTLSYDTEMVADELQDIVSGRPYQDIIFEVSIAAVYEGERLRIYRLLEIHSWYEE